MTEKSSGSNYETNFSVNWEPEQTNERRKRVRKLIESFFTWGQISTIKCKTKTKPHWVTHVFSRFKQVACFYFVLFFGLNLGAVCEWTLMMTSAQAVETSVTTTDSSPSQDYAHSDDQITQSLCSDWYLWFLWFWFVDASMKTDLPLNLARHHINLSKFGWRFKYTFCINCTKSSKKGDIWLLCHHRISCRNIWSCLTAFLLSFQISCPEDKATCFSRITFWWLNW